MYQRIKQYLAKLSTVKVLVIMALVCLPMFLLPNGLPYSNNKFSFWLYFSVRTVCCIIGAAMFLSFLFKEQNQQNEGKKSHPIFIILLWLLALCIMVSPLVFLYFFFSIN